MTEKNPIKEIAFNISFDGKLTVADLRRFCEDDQIKKDFPHQNLGFDGQLHLTGEPSGEFKQSGFILKSEGQAQAILTINLGRLTFHLIDQYVPFPEILEKLDRYWFIFQAQVEKSIPITHIVARYINQVQLAQGENLAEYVNVNLKAPFSNIEGQFMSFKLMPDSRNPEVKANVIIAENKNKMLILDLAVERALNKTSLTNISDVFIDLRKIKNDLFQQLIADKMTQRYNL